MSAAADRPNFFILLELDPDAPWNQTDFEIRLKEKQNQWSREANSPKADVKNAANSNLRLGREIQRVMSDPRERDREAKAYRTAAEAAKAPKLRQFEEDLAVLRGEGVTQDELDALVKTYMGVLTEREIRDRLTAEGIAVRDKPRGAAQPEEKPLDAVVAKQIHDGLSFLHEASLYNLLSKAPGRSSTLPLDFNSPSSDLLEAATLLSQWTFTQINAGPEVTAQRALAGQAQSIFKDENKRKQYDELLRRQPLDQLLKQIERLCAPLTAISPQRAEMFLRKAAEAAVPLSDATTALTKLIAAKGWPQILLSDPTEAVERLHACANCHRLNDPANQYCTRCKEPLWIDCPNCGAKHLDAGELACGKCRFPLTRHHWVVWALDETERLIGQRDWAAAAEQLDEARREWAPRHPDDLVRRMDALDQQIKPERERIEQEREVQRQREEEARRKEQERLEAERAARDAAITAIEASLHSRRLYEARRLLAEAPRATDEHPDYGAKRDGLKSIVDAGIPKAERLVKLAREAHEHGDDDEAGQRGDEAIEVAADCAEAHALLATLPVAAPRDLRIEVVGHTQVRLAWERPSASRVDGYTVRRKTGSAPARHDDGTLVEMTGKHKATADDTHAEQGVPIYYSVFARAGIRYSRPVTAATLLAAPITGLACEVTAQEVRLRWEPPSPHMGGVRVRRAEGEPPKTIEDGEEVLGAALGGVTDRDVRAETRYGYAVFAEYVAVSGRPVWSDPATIHAVPQTPPRPIADLHVERGDNPYAYAMAVLSCTLPESREVCIVQYADVEPPRPGSVERWDVLTSKRRVFEASKLPVSHAWQEPGACWYVPIVHVEDMGYVGVPVRFDCVNEVADLGSKPSGNDAAGLRWRWPKLCTRVEIATSRSGWPAAGARGVAREAVPRPAGAADGSEMLHELRPAGATELFVVATAYARAGDYEIASAGTRLRVPIGDRPRLTCKVEKGFLGRGAPRTLSLEMQGSAIAPALVVVIRKDRPPGDPRDGTTLYKQDSMEWRGGKVPVDLNGKIVAPNAFVGVFLTDPCEAAAVEVATPWLRLA